PSGCTRAGDHCCQSVGTTACADRTRRGTAGGPPRRQCAAAGYSATSALKPLPQALITMPDRDADRPVSGGAQQRAPAAAPPLTGATLAFGPVAFALAPFMNVLDTSIANVSLPAIAGDLGVSPDQGTWVITSFAVANGISVPLTGWLTRRFGQVKLFTAAVVLFVMASILCAAAPNLSLLILARVLQGAVAGPMIPLSQALLLASYPKNRAGTALAMWSITTLVAPVVGPV